MYACLLNLLGHSGQLSIISLSSTGFVDLQTEKIDLMENVGAIPFLDYKHFASRIFFPEVQWTTVHISQTDVVGSEKSKTLSIIQMFPLCYCFPERDSDEVVHQRHWSGKVGHRLWFTSRCAVCQRWVSDALLLSPTLDQDAVKVQLDECCHVLSLLIHNRLFLTSMVHALEEQKSFTIKDKSVPSLSDSLFSVMQLYSLFVVSYLLSIC